jgi:hypothetical protein
LYIHCLRALISIAAFLVAQSGVPIGPNGTIRGTVLDAVSGAPLADVQVSSGVPNSADSTSTNTGQYQLTGLTAGPYRISAHHPDRGQFVYTYAYLDSGVTLTLDLHLPPEASISGRVVDENQNPVVNQPVTLIRSEYQSGLLCHVADRSATTGSDGQYAFRTGLESGRAYLLLAPHFDPIPDAPADLAQRKTLPRSTYYPDSATIEGALPVTLQPGENRERVEIQMASSKPYCADGALRSDGKPGSGSFAIGEAALLGMPEYHASSTPDGKFRVCGLAPDGYSLTVDQWGGEQVYGSTGFRISTADLHGLEVDSAAGTAQRLEVAWDGEPPPGDVRTNVSIAILTAAGRVALSVEKSFPFAGAFPIHLPAGDYDVDATVTGELYVKQMTYGGANLLHHTMQFAGADGDTPLRIVVGRDGGRLAVTVNDADSHAVPAATVLIMPEEVTSVASLATRMVVGQADHSGGYTSATLAPGKYSLLACTRTVRRTPEDLGKLFDARSKAQTVELGPKVTTSATIQAVHLDDP